MSRRNFILLIIVLAVAITLVFVYLYSSRNPNSGNGDEGGINFLSIFNPFRSNTNNNVGEDGNPIDINGDGEITPEEITDSKLRKVSNMPISGFATFMKERLKFVPVPPPPQEGDTPPKPAVNPTAPPTELALALRYVERATGNVYQTFADEIEERRFSGTIIPKIYDAYFGSRAESVVMRHLKANETTIETYFGNLPKEKLGEDIPSNEIVGAFLPDGIKDISVSPDATKIFYLTESSGIATGTIMNLSDRKKTPVFSSEFTEWNSQWATANGIILTTRPSGGVPGYVYILDIARKSFNRLPISYNGLTTLMSPDGKLMLVGDNNLALYMYRLDTKKLERVGVNTLPEKCIWSKSNDYLYCAVPVFIPDGLYPDNWYRGEVSFSDQIWKVNLADGSTTMIADPITSAYAEDIDGTKLALDPGENYLFFVNKKDSFLWELLLK